MSAAALLRSATAAGVELALVDGVLKVRGALPDALRTALRERKAEVAAILRGDACRWCGSPLPWPYPAGIVLGDGSAECMACADREVWRLLAAADRVVNSPEALADPGELMIHGEDLP